MANERTYLLKFTGDVAGFEDATKRAGDSADGFGAKLATIGKVAVAAFAVAATAAVGFGIAGVKAYADFDQQMREVYTLLPGISQDAMRDMEEDVKSFSKEFGVLPKEVVPALYQSLSAGVPPGNVFEFLETAQKAAKGGVTDLTTAVDGISSVVNAYGAEVLGATQASDLMFTAVRLGKTDFNQLSASIFNVTPTAAALGVGFEDVTAALARLTAQGTPTSVATTQLRSLMNELGSETTKLGKAFQSVSGETFTQFIAQGGNLQEALALIRDNTVGGADGFRALFGSVEAMNAALGLSGPQAEAFAAAIAEMEASAGATDAAFQTMSGGINDNIAKIKANFAVLLLDVGQRLAPAVEKATSWIVSAAIPALDRVASVVQTRVGPALARFFQSVEPRLRAAGELVGALARWFLSSAIPAIQAFVGLHIEPKLAAIQGFFEALVPAVVAFGTTLAEKVQPILTALFEFLGDHMEILGGVAVAIGVGLVAAFTAWAISAGAAAVATIAATAPLLAIGIAIAAVAAGIIWLYQNWDELSARYPVLERITTSLREKFEAFVTWIRDPFIPAIQSIAETISTVVTAVVDFIAEHWPRIWGIIGPALDILIAAIETTFDNIRIVIETVLGVIKGQVDMWIGIFTGDWGRAWDGLKATFGAVWDGIKGIVLNALEFFRTDLIPGLYAVATNLGGALKDGFIAGIGLLTGVVKDISNAIIGLIEDGINKVIGWINRAIPDDISFTVLGQKVTVADLPDNPIPEISIPRLRQGGIVIAGDNPSGIEAVVPLERARDFGFGGGSTINVSFAPTLQVIGNPDPQAWMNQADPVLRRWFVRMMDEWKRREMADAARYGVLP